jgi:hypothetical protein
VPGWHAETKDLVASGKLRVAGILQEQHADRALLFHQWKGMDFPLMVDSYNELGVKVVPIHVLLDAQGRVVAVNPKPQELRDYLASIGEAAVPAEPVPAPTPLDPNRSEWTPEQILTAGTLRLNYGASEDAAIAQLRRATEHPTTAPRAWFRLGVALRHRFEDGGKTTDFAAAVAAWRTALALDPNHYIWRRRIQQYGPRLDKPYPFYDWVPQARSEIQARGEQAIALRVEPLGAEMTAPLPRDAAAAAQESVDSVPSFPDANNKITHDDGLILSEVIVVPDTQGRTAARVHLSFEPNLQRAAHWNNEVEPARLWLLLPDGWSSPTPYLELPGSAQEVSTETRRVEFELRGPQDATLAAISLVLLAHVCEGLDGTCVYRRIEVSIPLDALH